MKKLLMILAGGGFPQIETCLGCLSAIRSENTFNIMDSEVDWRGTSAGGIVSTLVALGYPPEQLIQAIAKTQSEDLVYRRWFYPFRWLNGGSIYNRDGLESFMCSFMGEKEATNVKVMLTRCSDDTTQEMNGNLKTCLGTSSIDSVFPLTNIDGIDYMDGGYNDNVPWYPAMLSEYEHIVIILPPRNPNMVSSNNRIAKLFQELEIKLGQEVNEAERIFSDTQIYPSVLLLRPPPCNTDLLSWSPKFELIRYAYHYTQDKLRGRVS